MESLHTYMYTYMSSVTADIYVYNILRNPHVEDEGVDANKGGERGQGKRETYTNYSLSA